MGPEGRSRGRRVLRAAIVLSLAILVVGGGALAWLYAQVAPGECRTLQRADLSIEEIIAIKQRVEAHQLDRSAPLRLSGREASFLLADTLRYPVHIAVDGSEVGAELALPAGKAERCYHVDFHGSVVVEEAVAVVVPSRLVVGELDLSGWVGGRAVELGPDDLREHAGQLLARMRQLQVEDGHLLVDIDMGGLR